jgi:hypothetical protein
MRTDHPNWKDRSQDDTGFRGSPEYMGLVGEISDGLHKLQTAIKFLQQLDTAAGVTEDQSFCGQKHNRVGIDNALLSHSSLVALLVDKGIITERDYLHTNLEFVEREVEMYVRRLEKLTGKKVTLR